MDDASESCDHTFLGNTKFRQTHYSTTDVYCNGKESVVMVSHSVKCKHIVEID